MKLKNLEVTSCDLKMLVDERRLLQSADVLDDRLTPAINMRPLAVAHAVLVAGHIDHVARAAAR